MINGMVNGNYSRRGFFEIVKDGATVVALGAVGVTAGCSTSEKKAIEAPSSLVVPSTIDTPKPPQKELWSLNPEQLAVAQRLNDIKDIGVFNEETLKDRSTWTAWILADLSKRGKYPADIFNQVVNQETGDKISAYNPWDKMLSKNADGVNIRAALIHNEALTYGYKTDMETTVPEPLDKLIAEKLTSVFYMNHEGSIYKSFMQRIPEQGNAKPINAAKSIEDTIVETKPGTYTDPHTNMSYDSATITLKALNGVTFDISSVFIDLSDVIGTTAEGAPAGMWVSNH